MSIAKNTLYAFADQLALSFVQFFSASILIYNSSPDEYGAFTFLISLYYLFNGIQNATVNTPLVIFLPKISKQDHDKFKKGASFLLIVINIISLLTILIFYLLDNQINSKPKVSSNSLLYFSLSIVPLMIRDFIRSNEYAALNPRKSLIRDGVYSVITSIAIAIVAITSNISSNKIFIIMAITASITVIDVFLIRTQNYKIYLSDIKYVVKITLDTSKWSLIGAISSWFQSQSLIYIPYLFINPKEVAYIAAARLVMTPAYLFVGSWGNYLRPLISTQLQLKEYSKVYNLLIKSTLIISTIIITYSFVILFSIKIIPDGVFPEKYTHAQDLIIIWAIILFFTNISSNISSFFQANLDFKKLSFINWTASIITVITTYFFAIQKNSYGIMLAQIIGQLLLIFLMILIFRRVKA